MMIYSIGWLLACGTFFFTTLEEYFTGVMYFPIIHGVAEGTVLACFLMSLSAYKGSAFFQNTIIDFGPFTMQLNNVVVIGGFIGSNIFNIMSIVKIARKFKGRVVEALYYTCSFLILISSLFIVLYCYRNNEDAWLVNSKIIIYVYGFAFAKLVVKFFF